MGSPRAERRRPANWLLLFGVTELVRGVGTGARGSPGTGEHWKCSIVSTVEVKIKVQKCFPLALECLGEGAGPGSLGREAPPCLPHSGEGGSETKGISRSSRHGNFSEHQCQCAVWPRVEAAASGSLCTPGPAPSALREGGVCPQREAWQGASSQIQAEPWSWGHPGLQEKAMVSSHAPASFSSHCGPSRRQEEETSGQNASPPCLHPQPGPSGRGWEDTHELTS